VAVAHTVVVPLNEIALIRQKIGEAHQHVTDISKRLITRRGMKDPARREIVQTLLDFAPPTAINHPQLRIIENHRLSVRRALSFHAIMLQRSEAARHVGVRDPVWRLDHKATGYKFADLLGVRRPATDLTIRPIAEIEPNPPVVVKPVRSTGARGVFLVYDHDRIVDVRTGDELRSWGELVDRARALMAVTTRRTPDQWITEELILDEGKPAHDLKFFAFYGRVLFVLEIERLPVFRRVFWTADGEMVETGKTNTLLDGAFGVSKDQVVLAERISAEIPSPFCRIDMLRSGPRGALVGEFTPRPGQFEEFNEATDRLLAEEWVRAERRRLDETLAGRRFGVFEVATR